MEKRCSNCKYLDGKLCINDVCFGRPVALCVDKDYAYFEPKEAPAPEPLGIKHDTGKPPWALLPFDAVEEIVKVLGHGAEKYSVDNWKHVDDFENRYLSAAMRHLSAHAQGNHTDSESGLLHLAHAGADILFLIWKELQRSYDAMKIITQYQPDPDKKPSHYAHGSTDGGYVLVESEALKKRAAEYPKIYEFLRTMPGVTEEERRQCIEDFATADEEAFVMHKDAPKTDVSQLFDWCKMPSDGGFWVRIHVKVEEAKERAAEEKEKALATEGK